jgi:protein phosphatase
MGTTLVAVLEAGDELLVASVGDSRAYRFEEDQLTTITEDQTWVQEVGRRLGIDEASLKTHPMRHVLTMAIGVSTPLRIHTYTIHPRPGAQFLLCSDGLHGVVDTGVIAQTLKSPQTLESKCHYLVEAAREGGGPDNITAVLLRAASDKLLEDGGVL